MQTAIDNAYDSIEEMGGDVPQARNLVNLSGTIDDLQNSVIAGVRGTNDAYQSTGKSYTKGESCIYNNVVYTAKDAISAPAGEFDPSKWDESSLASLRSSISDIIKIKNIDIGTITFPSYGYVDISSFKPVYSGYTLVNCSIHNYAEFTSGTAGAMIVESDGLYITGPANSKAVSIVVRYIFVKTSLLSVE